MRFGVFALVAGFGSIGLTHCDGGDASEGTGKCRSTPTRISTVPFQLNFGTTGEDGTGGEGGAGDAGGVSGRGASRCASSGTGGPNSFSRTICTGNVRRTVVDGAPAFVFDDGSTLTWTGSAANSLALPEAPDGANLWIDYVSESSHWCDFCVGTYTSSISIRESAAGQVLYVGSSGFEPDPSTLFGTTFELEPTCETAPQEALCYRTTYRRFDAVLDTDPVRRIPHGNVTRISVPSGKFDVFWAHADHTDATPVENCFDAVPPSNIREFAAVRVSE